MAWCAEGSGVVLRDRGPFHSPPSAGPTVYQPHANLFQAAGRHVVWGLWMVGDECRGLSARADV